ncbi:hypothetical protein ATANTOWER_014253, partial [Ataeniobius toweri]|nr:hypothetical protein [Ataeniobius toweri]
MMIVLQQYRYAFEGYPLSLAQSWAYSWVGLHQSCPLSQILFVVFKDRISTTGCQTHREASLYAFPSSIVLVFWLPHVLDSWRSLRVITAVNLPAAPQIFLLLKVACAALPQNLHSPACDSVQQ